MKNNYLKKSKKKRNRAFIGLKHDLIAWLLILPSIICFILFIWRPTLMGISYSFFELKGFEPQEFVGLRNYKVILSNTQFLKTLWNTVKYVAFYLVLGYIPPIIVAIMLNEVRLARKSLKFFIYFPAIVPGIVANMLWGYIYKPDMSGLLNNILGVFGISPQLWLNDKAITILCIVITMAWRDLGGNMLYFFAALQGVNRELYEAAVIDGAGVFHRIFYVTLPQISGIMLLFFVRSIISVFQVMEQPLVMTDGGPNGASMSLGLQAYRYAFVYYQSPYALALSVVEFFMLIGLTILYFKISNKTDTE